MRWFKEQGWQVDYVSSGEEQVFDCDNQYTISICRSPFNLNNLRACKELKKLIMQNNYNIIHCHTPMGAVITRIAAKAFKNQGLKIIHTAHGFQFFKGASIINWLFYYPVDRYLSRYTDALITTNEEDYELALAKFKAKTIYKIDGVGVDINRFFPISISEKNKLRKDLGYSDNEFILLYIAEFIPRKNHLFLLNQIQKLKKIIVAMKVIFVGKGKLIEKYKKIVKMLQIEEIVDFLGYRNDVNRLCQIADIHVAPSKQEGFGINNIEAMASGLPIVCSNVRGHCDVIINKRNGFLFNLNSPSMMVDSIVKLYGNRNLREEIGRNNIYDVKKYSLDIAISKMAEIYKNYI
jgi:glycosyltransferase EpsD